MECRDALLCFFFFFFGKQQLPLLVCFCICVLSSAKDSLYACSCYIWPLRCPWSCLSLAPTSRERSHKNKSSPFIDSWSDGGPMNVQSLRNHLVTVSRFMQMHDSLIVSLTLTSTLVARMKIYDDWLHLYFFFPLYMRYTYRTTDSAHALFARFVKA